MRNLAQSVFSSVRLGSSMVALCAIFGAANAADSIWDHNGSEMLWSADGNDRTISYLVPRSGLSVEPGTVLFEGRRNGNHLEGTARIFRQNCPPAEYQVAGVISDETHVVLQGAAPVRASSGCAVTGYSLTSSNATLEFTYLRAGEATVPGQDASDGWVIIEPAVDGNDAIGYRIFAIPLPDDSEITVRVDSGVASHVMPDMISATLTCGSGVARPVIPGGQLNACSLSDASADLIGHALVLDVLRYNSDTSACEPARFEYDYGGICD